MKKGNCVILVILILLGCGRFNGEFAFKKFDQDAYRRIDGLLEFEKNEKINWAYIFKNLKGTYNIGVTLLKKEIVWVDIYSKAEIVSETKNIIYGIIENLNDGIYKIILHNADRTIDEKEFVIFTEEDEYYKYGDQ